LPWTDGANLVFEYITKPLTKSWVSDMEKKMTGLIDNLIQTVTTVTHLWIVWAVFLFFPASLKRFITVCIGVIYPWISSVVAVNTNDSFDDDTRWLTYWACYGILYLIMVFLETWLGRIPGFYTLVIFSIVYLMLPITNGAEKIFRNVLVPLAGLRDLLMVKDALVIKKQMLDKLTPARRKAVQEAIASSFATDGDLDEANDPLIRFGLGLGGSGTKSGGKSEQTTNPPTETTPLV
jgi:TB2/DP1, HVA22 family